ncbi:hypothetical protein M2352_000912 [Azospirillum fermentarium]|uniref:hypothetical protein n=1 Tax=Azospirillum fermentarium TaxID=1233114 RepID=UPI0022273814|nr:hypothetical protein [Azospirillum fermentarium]MCW2245321.1 hypothetical protein [Azospirillum fermentarium]
MPQRSPPPPDSPPAGHEPGAGDADIRAKINDLVARLPPTLVYSLLSEIEDMAGQPPARLRLVRRFVVDHLNRQRIQRARRLFTTLFDAVLIDDPVLYHAGLPVPGMIQRADAGALWEVLSRDAFPLLAVEAQESLDEAARDEPLDRVMRSPLADGLRARMREASLRHLDGVHASPKAASAFLAALSRSRLRRQALTDAAVERPPAFDPETLRLARDVLAAGDHPLALVLERLDHLPTRGGTGGWQETADALAEDVAALSAEGAQGVAHLLPLLAMHRRQLYGAASLYVTDQGIPTPQGAPVAAALTAHFVGACRALAAVLGRVLALQERLPGSPIRPKPREMAQIDALRQRVETIMEAAQAGTLLENRHTEPAFSLAWSALDKAVTGKVAEVALERAAVAAGARRSFPTDGDETVWLLNFMASFEAMAQRFSRSTLEMGQWREHFLEEMQAQLNRAMKIGAEDPLDGRMAHVLRINRLCGIFGQRVTAWIGPTSQSMVRLITHRIQSGAAMDPEEEMLTADFLETARTELGRSRYWKSEDLMQLVELLEQRTQEGPKRKAF